MSFLFGGSPISPTSGCSGISVLF
uniref:Uncharacterized protein n=1 Tax=Arundo donax TaxID=35708 RepID=A0A0A8YC11_ARUDO